MVDSTSIAGMFAADIRGDVTLREPSLSLPSSSSASSSSEKLKLLLVVDPSLCPTELVSAERFATVPTAS